MSVRKTPRLLPAVRPLLQQGSWTGWWMVHLLNVGIFGMLVQAAANFEDSAAALAFYGVYHRNPWNQVLHFFGVPLILWSMLIVQAHVPLTTQFVLEAMPGLPRHYASWATLAALFYVLFYLSVDVTGGLLYFPVLYLYYATAVHWVVHDQLLAAAQGRNNSNHNTKNRNASLVPCWYGTGRPLAWAVGLHLFSWYLQIHPGHLVLEGARPAVLASVGGALSTAPLFAFYEGIWWLGLQQDFQQKVLQLVAQATAEQCAAGAPMRVCLSM